MASATPTAAMNAASATSTMGAALGFLPRGGTTIVGRGFGLAGRTSLARGGGERCSVVRWSSSGGSGSNGLRRLRRDADGAIGVGTFAALDGAGAAGGGSDG